jgi:hypothetical protein
VTLREIKSAISDNTAMLKDALTKLVRHSPRKRGLADADLHEESPAEKEMRTQDLPADDEVPQAKESSPPRPMINAIQPTVTKALSDVTVKSALQEWYTFDLDQDSHWIKMKQSRGKVKAIVEWGRLFALQMSCTFLKIDHKSTPLDA